MISFLIKTNLDDLKPILKYFKNKNSLFVFKMENVSL